MYEKPYTGLTAELKLNDVVLAYMSGFDLNLEKNIIEILQFGARYTEKVPAVKDWSANVDGTVALAPGSSQHKLYEAFQNDEEVTIGIFLDEFVYFEGKAYVGTFNITGAPDDKLNLTCDFEGNGAVILTLPNTYTVTANSGVGGTVIPGGAKRVDAYGTYQLTISPAPNYEVDVLEDNGVDRTSAAQGNRYTLSNVSEDHIITLTFKRIGGADKSNLRAAILYADTLKNTDYSPDTWATLTAALTEAKAVNGAISATQERVTEVTDNLNAAIVGLEKAGA